MPRALPIGIGFRGFIDGASYATVGAVVASRHPKYSGLRLLLRSGARFLLLPEDWEPGGTVFVLDEDRMLRYEFSLPPDRALCTRGRWGPRT